MDEVCSVFGLCPFPDTPKIGRHNLTSPYLHMSGLGGNVGVSLDNPQSGIIGRRLELFSQGTSMGDYFNPSLLFSVREGWRVQWR